ncbi:MAG: cytochrome c oxidase subunit II [Sutterellaceae bacterium]|nr:cytochrome c oxidase subunit II [Burkholderiaceae bacterium]MDW8429419.1 cytochrome c oxidase subunit II [Sutterellaceae bacterium]
MLTALKGALALAALGAVGAAQAIQSKYNLAPPATQIARDIHWLHWFMLAICGVIFVVVFGVMFYSIWAHRKSRGAVPAQFHESTKLEVIWTVIPFLIVIGMALPATKTVVAMKDTSNADLTIKVTGYQWKWGYDYLKGEGEGISFLSTLSTPRDQIDGGNDAARKANKTYLLEVDNELVVPVDKKIRIITTAQDVIHAWFVPALGVKQDAIPGFVRDTWFKAEKTGTFRGQCAELCGRDHAFMPIVVRVVTQEEYSKWVAEKKKALAALADDPNKVWTLADLKARGAQVYAANCGVCHQPTGKGVPNAFPALDGSKLVADKAETIKILLNGKNAMPAWKTLSDVELAAVATYIRNHWGNSFGEVQPAEVKAAR